MSKKPQFDMAAIETVAWMLHAQFVAQTMIISERIDESDDKALAARELARTGRDLAEMLALYLGGSDITLPGSAKTIIGGES